MPQGGKLNITLSIYLSITSLSNQYHLFSVIIHLSRDDSSFCSGIYFVIVRSRVFLFSVGCHYLKSNNLMT